MNSDQSIPRGVVEAAKSRLRLQIGSLPRKVEQRDAANLALAKAEETAQTAQAAAGALTVECQELIDFIKQHGTTEDKKRLDAEGMWNIATYLHRQTQFPEKA